MQKILSDYVEQNFERFLQELCDYSKIPSIAFPAYPQEPLELSAEWTAERMRQAGLEEVEILRVPGAPPYVFGEWCHLPDAPTVLLYAHHDVQPPGRPEKWLSPAFSPERRGGRLYGRGVVDDKAGGLMHLAAIEAHMRTQGKLPINIKFIIEGEEETGSAHLAEFLQKYETKLKCDAMVLTDTANLAAGLPSITYQLRGLVDAIVEVRTLDHPVHSGMWGGPGVDALTVLTQLLSRLQDAQGKILIPGIYDDIVPLSAEEKKQLAALPWDEAEFSRDLGAVASLRLGGEAEFSPYERLWCRPSLAILGIDAPKVAETSNQLIEWARAKVSLRIVRGMDPQKSLKQLCDFLAQNPPYGAELRVTPGAAGNPWHQAPNAEIFKAAERALTQAYGRAPAYIGCGGTIPFVKPLSEHFNIPALLIGLEDPICNAHGENESLHLDDWRRGILGAAYLYAEMGNIDGC